MQSFPKIDKEEERLMVERAQKNTQEFGALYEIYRKPIERFVRSKISSQPIAEDIASSIFEKALNSLSKFQWTGVSFGCWLFRIARNTVYDYYRSKKNPATPLDEEVNQPDKAHPSPEDSLIRGESELKLYSKISNLSSEDQYLLYFKYFEGMDNVEIAQTMDLSESNVATRLFRIRQKLKKQLD